MVISHRSENNKKKIILDPPAKPENDGSLEGRCQISLNKAVDRRPLALGKRKDQNKEKELYVKR